MCVDSIEDSIPGGIDTEFRAFRRFGYIEEPDCITNCNVNTLSTVSTVHTSHRGYACMRAMKLTSPSTIFTTLTTSTFFLSPSFAELSFSLQAGSRRTHTSSPSRALFSATNVLEAGVMRTNSSIGATKSTIVILGCVSDSVSEL